MKKYEIMGKDLSVPNSVIADYFTIEDGFVKFWIRGRWLNTCGGLIDKELVISLICVGEV
jgi:hypothetical protein